GQAAQPADILAAVLAGQVHVRVDHGRNPAALLLGHDHLDAVAFEDGDHMLSQLPLVVIDPAAVEIRHRAPRFRGAWTALEPALESQPLITRQGALVVDPQHALHGPAD